MTVVPLPDVPCVRVNVSGLDGANSDWGTRFFLSYSGSAPSAGDLNTFASDISSDWNAQLSGAIDTASVMNLVDIVDIATHTGFSGQDSTTRAGTRSGSIIPIQVAANVEFGIARRYRGGKPRAYLPFGVQGDLQDQSHWSATPAALWGSAYAAFIAAVVAHTIGSMGTLKHVNLSYYSGFTNHTNTSGRARAVPTYRATALHDDVISYLPKKLLGSQKRRRSATTP